MRHPAVDPRLQERGTDLPRAEPVAHRRLDMHRQLVVMAVGDQGGQRDQAALAPGQRRVRPDLAPGVAGDELLEGGSEFGGRRLRPVHVRVAQDLAAHGRPAPAFPGREVGAQRLPYGLRALGRSQVGGVRQLGQRGAGDGVGDLPGVRGRRGRILTAA